MRLSRWIDCSQPCGGSVPRQFEHSDEASVIRWRTVPYPDSEVIDCGADAAAVKCMDELYVSTILWPTHFRGEPVELIQLNCF